MERIKTPVDPFQPVAAFCESERGPCGQQLDTATVQIANHECPFRCIYCDLWKHTLDVPTPAGAVPAQIDRAFEQLGRQEFSQVKLYNAGNWFDGKAIPTSDHQEIAARLQSAERVIVENHPKLCDERVLAFRDLLPGQFEIAIGVETVDDAVLSRLDKSMTTADTERAVAFLRSHDIDVRAFVLFPAPYVTEATHEAAIETVEWCFQRGATVVVLIPLRTTTGQMPELFSKGLARSPRLEELEAVARWFTENGRPQYESHQRLFFDLWDASMHFSYSERVSERVAKLQRFNETQVFA